MKKLDRKKNVLNKIYPYTNLKNPTPLPLVLLSTHFHKNNKYIIFDHLNPLPDGEKTSLNNLRVGNRQFLSGKPFGSSLFFFFVKRPKS